jgi:DNA-binding LytR/AlgR family response regulator
MINIGICDDDLNTCTEIENLLAVYCNSHSIKVIIDTWYSGDNLYSYLKSGNTLDVLFLDIELLGKKSGIDVAQDIRNILCDNDMIIIFISSKSSYALELFKIQPLDFLIKPITPVLLEDVMQRCMILYERNNCKFEYHTKGLHTKLFYKDILYFFSQNKKIVIVTNKKETFEFNARLKDVSCIVPHNFILIHQSYLINLDYVSECSYEYVKMQNGDILSISQPYRKEVSKKIMKNEWEILKQSC